MFNEMDCAKNMEGKYHAATKDVQVLLVREECAVGMAQRDCAATKDVQVMFRKEGGALDMGKD